MKNILIMGLALVALTGCASDKQIVRTQQYTTVHIPDQMFECKVIESMPTKLTNRQVALLITELYQANRECRNNMDGLKTILRNAEARFGA